ncbi:hypothetical protein AGLY_014551 [Aphis glycines]|uniref:Bcl-2 Bcl-2 homology region 1-3 domain-containing protein n=1 Tax=Aphis glycines TaxID=307491 RepID=A0A6G0T5G4_APHGL|nr:hypothetical protein AGLY_014551 [Aphis glycines]
MKRGVCPKVVSSCLHARLPTSTTTTPQTQTTTTTTTTATAAASAGRPPSCPGASSASRRCFSRTVCIPNWAAAAAAASTLARTVAHRGHGPPAFSNVSDVVSRKLSHTIGWRTAVPTEQIARQGKALCVQYIRWKLKRAGAYTKKCAGALRAATAAANPVAPVDGNGGGGAAARVAATSYRRYRRWRPAPTTVTTCAAKCSRPCSGSDSSWSGSTQTVRGRNRWPPRPRPPAGASAAAGNPSAGAPPSADSAASAQQRLFQGTAGRAVQEKRPAASVVLVSVSRELFRAGAQVTWAKVVSLVCVAAGLAVDCARRGRADQLPDLIEAVGEVIEDDLAAWIHYNGGWMGLQSYCKPVVINVENPVSTQILYLVSLLIVVIFFLLLLRWFNFISVFR